MSWSQKLDVQKLILSKEKERRDIDVALARVFLLAAIMDEYYYVGSVKTGGGHRGIPAQWNREGDDAGLAGVLTCNEVEEYGFGEYG